MRTVSKKVSLTIGIVLCAVMLQGFHVSAEEGVEIRVGSVKGEQGAQIQIPISIHNSKQVAGVDLTVIYDSKELKFTSSEKGESAQNGDLCDINHLPNESSIRFVFASNKEINQDGNILLLNFDVISNDNSNHTVDVNVKQILNLNIQDLAFQVSGGREIRPSDGVAEEKKEEGYMEKDETPKSEQPSQEGTKEQPVAEVQKDEKLKRKIMIKTKDGVKDVTDTIGEKTNENLKTTSGIKQSGEETPSVSTVMPRLALALAGVVVIVGFLLWKRKKVK